MREYNNEIKMNYRSLEEIQVIYSRISLIRPLDLLPTPTQFVTREAPACFLQHGLEPTDPLFLHS